MARHIRNLHSWPMLTETEKTDMVDSCYISEKGQELFNTYFTFMFNKTQI